MKKKPKRIILSISPEAYTTITETLAQFLVEGPDEISEAVGDIREVPELLDAMKGLYKHCAMIHSRWGDGCNLKQANAAIALGKAAIKKAT